MLFAKEGAKVVCADLNDVGVQKTVLKIEDMVGKNSAVAIKVDVSKEDQVKAMVDKAVDTFGKAKKKGVFLKSFFFLTRRYIGKLDIMFNNAGIMHPEDDNALNTEDKIW
jgi:NAD(P)-dependent dehydrogenase (short-subunit alcohol dehydrogenase family)